MGILDDMQATLNRSVAGANRTASSLKLKNQLNDAMHRRQQLAGQLGASLYEVTKDDPAFRAGHEALYDGIAQIDQERANIQYQLDEIERQATAATQAATFIQCPFCHSRMAATDMFCSGCGKPMAEIQAAMAPVQPAAPMPPATPAEGPRCPHCGAAVNEGDAFCMSCGQRINE